MRNITLVDYLKKIRTNNYLNIKTNGNGYFDKEYNHQDYAKKIIKYTKSLGDKFLFELSSKLDDEQFGKVEISKKELSKSIDQKTNIFSTPFTEKNTDNVKVNKNTDNVKVNKNTDNVKINKNTDNVKINKNIDNLNHEEQKSLDDVISRIFNKI